MKLTVLPLRRSLDAFPGESLLDVFRRNAEPISHSCIDGRCGLCRCFVLESSATVDAERGCDNEWSFRERLACQVTPMTDCVVDIPDRGATLSLPARNDRGTIVSVTPIAQNAVRLVLAVKRPIQCLGGQHFELGFGTELRRLYSLSGACDGMTLSFDIQVHPFGVVSSHIRDAARVGDVVRIRGPLGAAYRRDDDSKLLLVSSGTGLGAMMGVMADIAAAGVANPVQIYAGFAFSEQVYARQELLEAAAALKGLKKCEIVVASGPLERGDRRGLVTDAIASDFKTLRGWRSHLFGTPTAVEACKRLLLARDLSPRRLHSVPYTFADLA